MGFIPVPDCVQVSVFQNQGPATHLVNVYHIQYAHPLVLNQSAADAIAGVIEDAYESSSLRNFLHTDWSIDHITVTDLSTSTSPQFNGDFDAIAGNDSTDPLAPQTSLMAEWITGLRGRSYRGKTYHGAFCEDGNNGQPTGSLMSAFGSFLGLLVAGFHSGSSDMSIVSKYSGMANVAGPHGQVLRRPVPRATGVSTPILSVNVDPTWRTQRRRSLKG